MPTWTATTSGTGTDRYWYAWNTATTTVTYSVSADTAWNAWHYQQPTLAQACDECGMGRAGPASHAPDCSATRAWREHTDRLNRERVERVERMARERQAAEARASELLRLVLAPDELATLADNGTFEVVGQDGRRYRVTPGLFANVHRLDGDGQVDAHLCAHPRERGHDGSHLPERDLHVGQVLALKHDIASFMEKVNVHWLRDGADDPRQARQRSRPDVPIAA